MISLVPNLAKYKYLGPQENVNIYQYMFQPQGATFRLATRVEPMVPNSILKQLQPLGYKAISINIKQNM